MILTGRVAKILDDGRPVLNRGTHDGVEAGQRYLIFTPGDSVQDPETGEDLGRVELVKGRATVVHAQERLAILEMDRSEQARPRTPSEIMATLSGREDYTPPIAVEVGDHGRLEESAPAG